MSIQTKKFLTLETNEKENDEDIGVVSSFEKLLEGIVANGRYQWQLLIAFLIPLAFLYSLAAYNFVLLLYTPRHHCHVPGRYNTNYTVEEWDNLTIPWEQGADGEMHLSQCRMFTSPQNSEVSVDGIASLATTGKPSTDCLHGWDYDDSRWRETPITKFDWVCDKKSYVTVIFSVNMAGSAFGTLTLSMMSDRFGRKKVFYAALFLNLIFGNALIFAPSYSVFVIMKFLGATAFFSVFNLAYIIVIEVCSARLRTITTFATFAMFILSSVCLSLIGWLLNEWKIFLLVTQLPLAVFILYCRFIPESPRWLLSRGKLDECEKIMIKIATTNGVKFTEEMHQLLKKAHEEGKKKVPTSKIFTSLTLTKHLVLIALVQSLGMFGASSLNLNVHNMKGNIFINYILLRSFELPGDIFSIVNSSFVGRRMNDVICMALASVAVIASSFFVTDVWPLIVMCGITKMFLRADVYSCYVHTGELFPTPLRATAYGIVGIVGIASTVLSAPLVALGDINARLPYYILCGVFIIGTIIATFLPETIGNPLPQTIKEAKQIGKGQSYFSFNPKGNANKGVSVKMKTLVVREASTTGSTLSLA